MTDNISINMFKLIEDEENKGDTGCRRMAKFLAFHNFRAKTMLVSMDALIASNGGEPVEMPILLSIFPQCLSDDFFLNKKEFRDDEILEWLSVLSGSGIFEIDRAEQLVGFRKDLDSSLLIKDSLEYLEKTVGKKAGDFSKWLSQICRHYLNAKESDNFKASKEKFKREKGEARE